LHVDAREFLRVCRMLAPKSSKAGLPAKSMETVADAIHRTWRELGRKQGWLETQNDVDYTDLSSFYKNSNRAAADRMATNLALIGLGLKPGRNTPAERETIRLKIEYNLELLAESEHKEWMEWHLDQGWQYAPEKGSTELTREPKKKTHPCLRPYIELSDVERNKDRDSIRHYLEFADVAKMKIVTIR
jgi:hypothetical protein